MKRVDAAQVKSVAAFETHTPERFQLSPKMWAWASLAVLLVAIALRFYALDLKPMHHDEGVNGFFLTRLLREGFYHYDPENYHGATLYYLTLPFALIFGLNEYVVRGVTALAGVLSVALLLALRRRIGDIGALASALLLAVSPCAIYYSRYFIHESLFVLFTIALVVFAWRFYDDARTADLMYAAVAAALLFATKETAFITIGVLLIAAAMTIAYARIRGDTKVGSFALWRKRFGEERNLSILIIASVAVFFLINILFYSSFFTNSEGVNAAISTFKIWTRTGTSEFHRKPFDTYFIWLKQEELALMMLAMIGIALAAWRASNRFAVFAALWAIGIVAAYSLVPYKTPWLALNFLPPLAIVAGYAVDCLWTTSGKTSFRRLLALGLIVGAAGVAVYQSVALNFQFYDDDRYPYVYAHTKRDALRLVRDIERLADENRRANSPVAGVISKDAIYKDTVTSIAIAAPEYWSLPWYLRDYKSVAYPPRDVAKATEQLLIVSAKEKPQADLLLADSYREVGIYDLRPGVELVLYARKSLGDKP